MKTQLSLTIASVIFSLNAFSFPIQIDCGNTQQGKAVKFSISPLKKVIAYKTFHDGVESPLQVFAPSHGIYDASELTFNGRDYDSDISIHGNYSQILRINHFASISIVLETDRNSGGYHLRAFSDGHEISSDFKDEITEESHVAFEGLTCSIVGM